MFWSVPWWGYALATFTATFSILVGAAFHAVDAADYGNDES